MSYTPETISAVAALWRSGMDTAQIAKSYGIEEHRIANMMPAVLDYLRLKEQAT